MPSLLIVDDETANLVNMGKTIGKSIPGITVFTAQSGREGLEIADRQLPDTLLLDVMMPDMDGFAVCRKLRANPLTRHIPIIVLTGIGDQMNTKIKALETGADAFLSKPVRRAELVAQVKAMLRIKIAEDKIRAEKKSLKQEVDTKTGELKRAQADYRALASHIQSLQEEERTRIARELHDELGQMVTGITLGNAWLLKQFQRQDFPRDKQNYIAKTNELSHITDSLSQSIHRIISDLRPSVLNDLGLLAAISWLSRDFYKKSGIVCKIRMNLETEPRLQDGQKTAVFRILQEALTNAARHAHASQVTIQVNLLSPHILFKVHDDGKGITPEDIAATDSFGILGMKERAAQLGWHLRIEGSPGQGTVVTLTIPEEK